MGAYLSQLKSIVAEQLAAADQQKQQTLKAESEKLIPLDERLKRLLKTIPDELLCEGLSLKALQQRLKGRRRGNAHPGELGDALRKLGFKRERRWRSGAGFSAIWRRVDSQPAISICLEERQTGRQPVRG